MTGMRIGSLEKRDLQIPPNARRFRSGATLPIAEGCTVYSVTPRMHLLGRSIRAAVEMPDGRFQSLIYLDDWDFGLVRTYWLKNPMHVPRGSKLHLEGVYNNSESNALNPNRPPKIVRRGDDLSGEILSLIFTYVPDRMGH